METTTSHTVWVAYGPNGVTGSIRESDSGYVVTMTRASEPTGPFPTLEAAKGKLHALMPPGSARPRFERH